MAPAPRKSSVSSPHPLSSLAPARPSLYTIPSPFAPPWCPSPDPEHHHHHHHEGHPPKRQPSRFSVRMPSEIPLYKPHWLSRLRSALRLLIIVLSGGVAVMLAHTLHIYRGNTYLDLRKGELPMTWPARTNLAPTLVLLCIANANFLASVAIMSVSFTKSFRRPMRSRDIYRIVAGSFGVVLWVTALVVFNLLGKASKASLGRYACMHRNVMSNGRYQYRAVCEEQGVAYYLAIGAASAEVLTLATLGVSALLSAKHKSPRRRYSDKKDSISFGVTGRFP